MLRTIVHTSVQLRWVVLALASMLLAYGVWVAGRAKVDVFPDFVPPQVTIQTEAPGLAPEQVELLVTRPIENAVNGLGSQESLRSETIQGLSVITVVFKEGTDIHVARQMLAEKLGELAGSLPAGVRSPKVSPLVSSTMDLLKIGLVSDKLSPMELRSFADWTLKPRLLAVEGVAKCSVFGGEVRQLQIQVRPSALVVHGLSITDVLNAARGATGVRGGGFIENRNQRVVLQLDGQLTSPADVGDVVIITGPNGAPVRLRDVADVAYGPEPMAGDAVIMDRPGVLMTMSSQFGANTRDTTRRLEAALEELKPVIAREGITLYPSLHRPATFIDVSLQHIRSSLLTGAVLVAVILFVFLGHFRTALISLVAIPLSLLTAVIVLDRMGVTLNTITLGGLAIAIGEVVDDAIIDVENIIRRLRENQAAGRPRSVAEVVLSASIEVRSAVVYATFVVALVFVPVLTLTGLQGSFFAPLAKAYILAIMASLVVALTVTPAMTALFFARGTHGTDAPRLQVLLRSGYERTLRWITRHAAPVVLVVAALVVLALTRISSLGGEFLPDFREGHFVIQVALAPGTSLGETARVGRQVAKALLANPHIATVEQQIGRAELGEDTWGPHQSEFHVELKPISGDEEEQMPAEIRKILAGIPGIQFEVMTFLADRIGESISGETAPVVVNVFGDNLDELDAKAAEIAGALRTVAGAADVAVKAPPGAPRIGIRLRPRDVAWYGLRPVEVLEAIQTAYQGTSVAQIFRESEVTDVAVILDPATRQSPEELGALLLSTAAGQRVPLHAVADIYRTEGRFSILHDGARRRQTITCNPTRDAASFVADARRVVGEKVVLPKGCYVEFAGAAETQKAASRELLLNSLVAGIGIVLLLSMVLGHWRNLLLLLLNLPFALAGGVLVVYGAKLLGSEEAGSLTMGSLVGFVTLFGITTRNGIMLLSHCDHLVSVENRPWNLDTAIRAASERLVPILMTATVTALGLLPLALRTGQAGCEIEGPMALVILGGLVTSTLLNLLILPTLALRFGRFGHVVVAK